MSLFFKCLVWALAAELFPFLNPKEMFWVFLKRFEPKRCLLTKNQNVRWKSIFPLGDSALISPLLLILESVIFEVSSARALTPAPRCYCLLCIRLSEKKNSSWKKSMQKLRCPKACFPVFEMQICFSSMEFPDWSISFQIEFYVRYLWPAFQVYLFIFYLFLVRILFVFRKTYR